MPTLFSLLHKVFEIVRRDRDQSLGIEVGLNLDLCRFSNGANIPALSLASLGLPDNFDGQSVHIGLGRESTDLHEIARVDEIRHAFVRGRVHAVFRFEPRIFVGLLVIGEKAGE